MFTRKGKDLLVILISILVMGMFYYLVTNKESVLSKLRENGYNQESLLINTLLCAAIVTMIILNFLINSNNKNKEQQLKILRLTEDINNINKNIAQIVANNKKSLNEKICSLNKLVVTKQRMINILNLKIEEVTRIHEENCKGMDKMTNGIQSLYYILNNEKELEFSKQEISNFIACYKIIDNEFIESLENSVAGKITPKEELFCILNRLEKSPEEIQQTLNLSKDAYRQLKYRTLKRLRTSSKLKLFCDKIQAFEDGM